MALRASDRYESALDFANDIQRWLDGEPTHAYRETWLESMGRWAHRHKTAAWLGGVLTVAILLIATTALVLIGTSARNARLASLMRLE